MTGANKQLRRKLIRSHYHWRGWEENGTALDICREVMIATSTRVDNVGHRCSRWWVPMSMWRGLEKQMWAKGFRYSWRKTEVAAQDKTGCRKVVCGLYCTEIIIQGLSLRHMSVTQPFQQVTAVMTACWYMEATRLNDKMASSMVRSHISLGRPGIPVIWQAKHAGL